MNWNKILLGGVAAGIVNALANYVMHGMIMANTYSSRPEVFSQEQANPIYFFVNAIVILIVAAIIFDKTRSAWAAGATGGAVFGALIGAVIGFTNFYWPLVIADFPYYLSWCWLGIDVIGFAIAGLVLGLIHKGGTG